MIVSKDGPARVPAEYLTVKPPIRPVVKARRRVGDSRSVATATSMIKPRKNEPRTLTARVPHGKAGPAMRSSQPESR
jgi:hypothetical protein